MRVNSIVNAGIKQSLVVNQQKNLNESNSMSFSALEQLKSVPQSIAKANLNIKDNPYPNATPVQIVSFKGGEAQAVEHTGRALCRGMWMHLAQLPAERSHIGQWLDPETNKFIQFMHKSRQTHWIVNPLTPFSKDKDLSPYNPASRFDRNKYFINLNILTKEKYGSILHENELPDVCSTTSFSLDMLREQKDPRFDRAYERFVKLDEKHPLKVEFNTFCEENKSWINNNAAFEGITSFVKKANVDGVNEDWRTWPKELLYFPENTKGKTLAERTEILKNLEISDERFKGKKFEKEDLDKIGQFKFEQFLFDKQSKQQKEILDAHGIKLFVDMAYIVDHGGKDVWANKGIVELDEKFMPKRKAGCMPEAAYPQTQRWGQAVWNFDSKEFWDYQEATMKKMLSEGCIKIDHFGGLVNRGALPAKFEHNGKIYTIEEALKPENEGGLGEGYWEENWLDDVSKKTNSKGETLIDMYLRIAKDAGLNPSETFIVEDLGGVCETPTFKNVMKKYGDKLAGLRLPFTYGIDTVLGRNAKNINSVHNPYLFTNDENCKSVALLSGLHDPASQMEVAETLLKDKPEAWDGNANSTFHFRKFLQNQLGLNPEEMGTDLKNLESINKKLLKWLYQKPAKHVQSTVADALAIFFRQNIPGDTNFSIAKYLQRPGTTSEWNRRFYKDFLTKNDELGINEPYYKDRADSYTEMMQDLFGKPEKPKMELDTDLIIKNDNIEKDEEFVQANLPKAQPKAAVDASQYAEPAKPEVSEKPQETPSETNPQKPTDKKMGTLTKTLLIGGGLGAVGATGYVIHEKNRFNPRKHFGVM